MRHQADVARFHQPALHAHQQLGEEGIGQIVDDHPDDVRRLAPQIGGAAVVDVAERVGRLAHPRGGLGLISGLPCSTSDTVDLETPASRAMSVMVTEPAGYGLALAGMVRRLTRLDRDCARLAILTADWNVPIIALWNVRTQNSISSNRRGHATGGRSRWRQGRWAGV